MSNVDHPSHYGGEDNPYEVIKVMKAWLTAEELVGALKFNVHTYLARAIHKNGSEDYAKAAWYSAYLSEFSKNLPASQSSKSSGFDLRLKIDAIHYYVTKMGNEGLIDHAVANEITKLLSRLK